MAENNATREELRQSLSRLHAELAGAPRIDQATRRLLQEILADVERVLQAAPPDRGPSGSAPQRLESLVVEFQAQHPVLAASLQQFIDLLGRAGL